MRFNSFRAVFFDADGTLYEPAQPIGAIYSTFLEGEGIQAGEAAVQAAVSSVWKNLSPLYLNTAEHHASSEERDAHFWKKFVADVAAHFGQIRDPDLFYRKMSAYYARGTSRRLIPEGVKILRECRRRGLITGVFTNNNSSLFSLIPELGLAPDLDYLFTAALLGYKKPSPLAFREIEKRTGLSPEEHCYVGNDPLLDIAAARAAGWQTHCVRGLS